MVSAHTVSVSYGAQQVLTDVSLTLDTRARAGLVGANGSGKTTLLRVLSGSEQPESGSIVRSKDSTIAYLPQRTVARVLEYHGYPQRHEL